MDANRTRENRYHRQQILPQIGAEGQREIAAARVLLVGCGALGTVIADQLARAGVGFLRIVDRDVVELTNLQRQVLFDEEDARQGLPKAVAAANRLRRANSTIEFDARVADVHSGNVEELMDVDLLLDGTDNAETRYLINDAAVKHGVPWVYGACVGTEGRVMAVVPATGPCLRCIFPEPPAVGELATCDTAGVLAPAAAVVASHQVVAAMKVLTGAPVTHEMVSLDLWSQRSRTISLADARRPTCPCCCERRFEYLDRPSMGMVTLCGRNAVQIRPQLNGVVVDLDAVSRRLGAVGEVQRSDYMVRCQLREDRTINLSLFPDGRLIVYGTNDVARARSLAARLVGV